MPSHKYSKILELTVLRTFVILVNFILDKEHRNNVEMILKYFIIIKKKFYC